MALSPRIELRQSQSLVMTPQLQQAIKLLQMSNLELADFVADEVERNPLLELAPPPGAGAAPGAGGGGGGGDAASWRALAAAAEPARASARADRHDAGARRRRCEAALILADELEDDGYLRAPLAEVAARHRLSAGALAAGLRLLQACDPAGVGARSLAECLALQLRERDRLDPAMQALLANLGLAARGRDGRADGDLRRRRRGHRRHAGGAARARPQAGAALRRGAGASWRCRTSTWPRAAAAAGRSSSTPRRCRGCWSTTSTPRGSARGDGAARAFVSEMQRRARTGWCAASSSGRAPS